MAVGGRKYVSCDARDRQAQEKAQERGKKQNKALCTKQVQIKSNPEQDCQERVASTSLDDDAKHVLSELRTRYKTKRKQSALSEHSAANVVLADHGPAD